jgi:hypothetical protein
VAKHMMMTTFGFLFQLIFKTRSKEGAARCCNRSKTAEKFAHIPRPNSGARLIVLIG